MKFMEKVLDDSMEIWKACANEKFLNEMSDGSLNKDKFLDYLVQDSIYLRDYLKIFAYAIVKSGTLKDMQLFYSMLGYVNDGENVTRLSYLKEFNLTDADVDKMDKRRQCEDYCNFLIKNGKNGSIEEIIMAMLPCMLGYNYVFEQLAMRAPKVLEGYFAPLVKDYISEGYRKSCKFWIALTDKRCADFDDAKKDELMKIFRQASLHELYFWQMAGESR